MIHESPNWRVTRRIGAGDREHVRSGVLSILVPHSRYCVYAIEASYRACVEIGLRPRIYLNMWREHAVIQQAIINLTHRFSAFDAQLMEYGQLDEARFKDIFAACELVVEPKTNPNLNVDTYIDELVVSIKDCWSGSGYRFLQGNQGRLSSAELERIWPQFHPDPTPFHYSFNPPNADPI